MRFLALTTLAFILCVSVASAALAPGETQTCEDPPRKILRTYDREPLPFGVASTSGEGSRFYFGARRVAAAVPNEAGYTVENRSEKGQISVRC